MKIGKYESTTFPAKVVRLKRGICGGTKCWFCLVNASHLKMQFWARPFDDSKPNIGDDIILVFQDDDIEKPVWFPGLDLDSKDG